MFFLVPNTIFSSAKWYTYYDDTSYNGMATMLLMAVVLADE